MSPEFGDTRIVINLPLTKQPLKHCLFESDTSRILFLLSRSCSVIMFIWVIESYFFILWSVVTVTHVLFLAKDAVWTVRWFERLPCAISDKIWFSLYKIWFFSHLVVRILLIRTNSLKYKKCLYVQVSSFIQTQILEFVPFILSRWVYRFLYSSLIFILLNFLIVSILFKT